MNKTALYLVIGMFLISGVIAYSSASNSTVPELANLTRADNMVEVFYETNILLDGILGLFIVIAVLIVTYLVSMYFTGNVSSAMVFSSFFTAIIAVLLYLTNLVNGLILQISIVYVLISIGYAIMSR